MTTTINSVTDQTGALQPVSVRIDQTVRREHRLYRFENGYGASVVRSPSSYGNDAGLWELAVIRWDDKGEWELTYETPITDDVIGWLDEDQVQGHLYAIRGLARP